MTDRYSTNGKSEGEFQPGSDGKVLKNIPGITDADEMDDLELQLLEQLYESVYEDIEIDQVIKISDISEWHRKWFGNIYEWAGRERSVNMSKGDFHFAAARQIPRLLNDFDRDYLGQYTPCNAMSDEQLIEAIAIVHIEFILIHPFREGNGRLSRLLINVLALQADKPELDFSSWDADRENYFFSDSGRNGWKL